VRYYASESSQGVTAAILAWPPPGAAAAFSTRLRQSGTALGRLEGFVTIEGAPLLEAEAGLESEIQDTTTNHARGVRVRVPGSAACSQSELCSTVRTDTEKRCQRGRSKPD
jgi:hypothetical protein